MGVGHGAYDIDRVSSDHGHKWIRLAIQVVDFSLNLVLLLPLQSTRFWRPTNQVRCEAVLAQPGVLNYRRRRLPVFDRVSADFSGQAKGPDNLHPQV